MAGAAVGPEAESGPVVGAPGRLATTLRLGLYLTEKPGNLKPGNLKPGSPLYSRKSGLLSRA